MNNYFVYRHTSPSGKIYIGITCQKLSQRWANGKGYKGQRLFWNTIQKYGWNNIKHEILFEGLTKDEAEQTEIKLIAQYKLQGISLNSAEGGKLTRGWHQRPEIRHMISEMYKGEGNPNFGTHHTEEHKRKISKSLLGKSRPVDVRAKISAGHKGKPKSKSHRQSLSNSIRGRKFINKNGQLKQVRPEEIEGYLTEGWTLGFIKKQTTN